MDRKGVAGPDSTSEREIAIPRRGCFPILSRLSDGQYKVFKSKKRAKGPSMSG